MPAPFNWFIYLLFAVLLFIVVLWALRMLGVTV